MQNRFASSTASLKIPTGICYQDLSGKTVEPRGLINGIVFFGRLSEVVKCATIKEIQDEGADFLLEDNGNISLNFQNFRMRALMFVNGDTPFNVMFVRPFDPDKPHEGVVDVCPFFRIEEYIYRKRI